MYVGQSDGVDSYFHQVIGDIIHLVHYKAGHRTVGTSSDPELVHSRLLPQNSHVTPLIFI